MFALDALWRLKLWHTYFSNASYSPTMERARMTYQVNPGPQRQGNQSHRLQTRVFVQNNSQGHQDEQEETSCHIFVVEICWTTWNEQTIACFPLVYGRTPSWVILQRSRVMLEMTIAKKKQKQLQTVLTKLSHMLRPWRNNPILDIQMNDARQSGQKEQTKTEQD